MKPDEGPRRDEREATPTRSDRDEAERADRDEAERGEAVEEELQQIRENAPERDVPSEGHPGDGSGGATGPGGKS